MKAKVSTILTAALLLLVLPARALPGREAGEDIPITDPVLLERMGLAPDATDIYATEQALQSLLMDPAEYAAAQKALVEADLAAEPSPAFGTSTPGYTSLGAYAFRPHRSRIEYAPRTTAHSGMACSSLGAPNDTPRFIAELEALPHGAQLESMHFWIADSHATQNVTMRLYRTCFPDAGGSDGTNTLINQVSTFETPGTTYLAFSIPYQLVDNQSCVYRVWADLGGNGICDVNNLYILKATARWYRQISPPPVTATFNDVPTGHPFFRHIEALVAAGITSGCGDGSSFCPNGSLTRGQMAVFLSTALGLHWGTISQ